MKNIRTPRTLSDAQFDVGYPVANQPASKSTPVDVVVAVVIGLIAAALAWHWLAV